MVKELVSFHVRNKIDELHENYRVNKSNRLRTPNRALDIDEFFPLLVEVLRLQQEQDGITTPILLTEEMPENDDNITGEVITYTLAKRMPGVFEAVPTGLLTNEKRIRNRKKLFRESFPDPDNPGMVIQTYGQEFDNWIIFTIWARTNRVANERAMWFEDLMEEWEWYFQLNGIKRVLFEERMADVRLAPENRKLVGRPFRYYFRTEKVTVEKEAALRSLEINCSKE